MIQNDTRIPGPNAVDRVLVDSVEGVRIESEVSELLVLWIQCRVKAEDILSVVCTYVPVCGNVVLRYVYSCSETFD